MCCICCAASVRSPYGALLSLSSAQHPERVCSWVSVRCVAQHPERVLWGAPPRLAASAGVCVPCGDRTLAVVFMHRSQLGLGASAAPPCMCCACAGRVVWRAQRAGHSSFWQCSRCSRLLWPRSASGHSPRHGAGCCVGCYRVGCFCWQGSDGFSCLHACLTVGLLVPVPSLCPRVFLDVPPRFHCCAGAGAQHLAAGSAVVGDWCVCVGCACSACLC